MNNPTTNTNPLKTLPHPRALAFLGDAVYEMVLREEAVRRGLSQSQELHAFTSARAKGESQVALLHALKPQLSEVENEIIRQGRNVGVGVGRRAGQATHRLATGFETLLGALHLSHPERLTELLNASIPLLDGIVTPVTTDTPQSVDSEAPSTSESPTT